MQKKMIFVAMLVLVLSGCFPGQSPADEQPDVQALVNTAVAETLAVHTQVAAFVEQTMEAQQAQQEPTATIEFTETPTSTPLAIPTFTPFTPTVTPVPGGSSGGVVTQPQYACIVINNRPKDNTVFNRNTKFDIKWTVVNKGTKTWAKGVDVKYYSGPEMTGVKRVEIPKEMKPNDTYVINLDAVAPSKKGYYVMTWIVEGPICYAYVAINVK